MRSRSLLPLLLICLAAACGDPNGTGISLTLFTDTLTLMVPSETAIVPSAVDLTNSAASPGGPCFGRLRTPERAVGAICGWDFAVRRQSGDLVFVPAGAVGLMANAGVSQPDTRSFEEIREAPRANDAYVTDSAVVVQPTGVYLARSRTYRVRGTNCVNYAKLQVLDVDTLDAVQVELVTNGGCRDNRLVPEDG